MLRISIDNATPQVARNGRSYVSFWARVIVGPDLYFSIAGFKYFPDNQSISTPTQGKGDGKFVNLTKMSGGMYNAIREVAERQLGAWMVDAAETVTNSPAA